MQWMQFGQSNFMHHNSQLQEMGFLDAQENVHALIVVGGNVTTVVEWVLWNLSWNHDYGKDFSWATEMTSRSGVFLEGLFHWLLILVPLKSAHFWEESWKTFGGSSLWNYRRELTTFERCCKRLILTFWTVFHTMRSMWGDTLLRTVFLVTAKVGWGWGMRVLCTVSSQ